MKDDRSLRGEARAPPLVWTGTGRSREKRGDEKGEEGLVVSGTKVVGGSRDVIDTDKVDNGSVSGTESPAAATPDAADALIWMS